ncbi:hypothetical protein KM043_004310 [Ampulex compressa]|nr:hypothetical protein KM043_004310 [Ampulex compressa]
MKGFRHNENEAARKAGHDPPKQTDPPQPCPLLTKLLFGREAWPGRARALGGKKSEARADIVIRVVGRATARGGCIRVGPAESAEDKICGVVRPSFAAGHRPQLHLHLFSLLPPERGH